VGGRDGRDVAVALGEVHDVVTLLVHEDGEGGGVVLAEDNLGATGGVDHAADVALDAQLLEDHLQPLQGVGVVLQEGGEVERVAVDPQVDGHVAAPAHVQVVGDGHDARVRHHDRVDGVAVDVDAEADPVAVDLDDADRPSGDDPTHLGVHHQLQAAGHHLGATLGHVDAVDLLAGIQVVGMVQGSP